MKIHARRLPPAPAQMVNVLVLEFCAYGELFRLLGLGQNTQPLPSYVVREYFHQLMDGLAYCHGWFCVPFSLSAFVAQKTRFVLPWEKEDFPKLIPAPLTFPKVVATPVVKLHPIGAEQRHRSCCYVVLFSGLSTAKHG